jgi:tetratricopeptide (TPR) repeat protein
MATKPVMKKVASRSNVRSTVRSKAAKPGKSVQTKAKAKPVKAASKPVHKAATKPVKPVKKASPTRKVESRSTKVVRAVSKPTVLPKSRPMAGALQAYEVGIKLMYAENYEKAIKSFNDLINLYTEEPEIQASARARIHACEMKLHERARSVYRSADDHYNVAVAMMNRGDLDSALTHLQSALKLAPKGDHILYAMAAANALRGNKDQALSYLKQSIHHRPANRFQAAKDNDFAALNEEPGFKELLTSDK